MKTKYLVRMQRFIAIVSILLLLPSIVLAHNSTSNSLPGTIGLDSVSRPGVADEDLIAELNAQAYTLLKQGDAAEAERMFRQASKEIDLRKQITPAIQVAVINGLGLSEFQQRKYADAEKAYLAARKIIDDTHLNDDYVRAVVSNDLGQAYRNQGKFELAEPCYKEALSLKEETASHHIEFMAATKCNLGLLYFQEKRYQDAEPFFTDGMSVLFKTVGPASSNYASLVPYYQAVLKANGHSSSIPGIDQ